ncbi:hypothetical protein PAHAL_3G451700 [Panicum hallii]|uniref:Uncharacterized protein n=2 Tax=Panicum hallii TaxID=206008 RepID=A0A2T8KLG3_9POAL|nr:hypothetical protein PAHAL_3G451700 [Panicum hallii]
MHSCWSVYPQSCPAQQSLQSAQLAGKESRCASIHLSIMGSGSSGEVGASEAISLVLRIATVGLSLASAIMTAASTQCVLRDNGVAAGAVSYGDYYSFKYSALADLLSAVLQGVAIYLEATRKGKAARAVELIDKLAQALTSTSGALLLAVDDITSCGGPPRGGGTGGRRQRGGGLCGQAGAFCGRFRVSSALSVAASVSVSASVYTRHAPVAVTLAPRPAPPSAPKVKVVVRREDEGGRNEKEEEVEKCEVELIVTEKAKEKDDKEEEKKDDGVVKDKECCTEVSTPPAMPPPWCRCPRLTIPCDCEDPELCGAFF